MRRTYRSKKDTGGGVDHRDMALSVDSKTSIFDAYYIQNIKQVKREMSCVSASNPYTTASHKVRKRKYVKRLKDPEPLRESLSESAYLTPDKSIRVNKIPDLFDRLLNSSKTAVSPKTTATSQNNAHNSVQMRMSKKSYCRKKLSKAKKFNHSTSDDTDSDKENSLSDESYLQNTSNVKAHELIIEKEKVISPQHHDDSINKIAEIYPALNKLRKRSTKSCLDESDGFSNILINITQSPVLPTSPQCSTPFLEKYRGKSIFKFSPIKTDVMEISSKSIDKSIDNSSESSNIQNDCNGVSENNTVQNITNIETNSEFTKENENVTNTDNLLQNKDMKDELQVTTKNDKYSFNNTEQLFSSETTSFSTTEFEPFLGFSVQNCENDNDTVDEGIPDTDIPSEQLTCKSTENINSSIESKNSTQTHNKTNIHVDDLKNTNASSDSESLENLSFSMENKNSIQSHNETNIDVEDLKNKTASSGSEFLENESFYDTCDSEDISDYSFQGVKPKVLTVAIERLNNSVFQKYYKKMIDSSLNNEDNNSNNTISDDKSDIISNINESDYESFKDLEFQEDVSSNLSKNICSDNDQLYSENVELIDVQIISSSENENSDSNDIEEEDKCLSFVTTRRRNDVTNDSFIINMDNSYASTASLDKTVLSNKRERLKETDLIDNTLVNDSAGGNINNDIPETDEQIETGLQLLSKEDAYSETPALKGATDEEVTNINTRKSSKLFRDSIHRLSQSHADEINSGLRQGIVLKPGKKWERSLSIYRRMTTMGDTFDHTILDDECLKTKGRKYRQSVISTMEMQEYQGSLHNESVFSRRSTFVSKPRRSTIKIFKDPNASGISLSSSILYEDLEGFLNGDCDDTIIELSKLSISDSGHEVTVLDKFHDTSNRIVTARDYVLRRCNQTEPVLFDECYPETVLKNCRKIGEGVYGEVFLWRAGDGRARVMKIVPIAGTTRVNGEEQKDFHQIISEIVIAMELSALRAPILELDRQLDDGKEIDALDLQSVQNATDVFNEVLAIRCVYGPYPSRLLDLWELYDECKGSENDNPAALPADQQYIVLELANAGQDLESYQFNNAEQAYALFKQIALGLAVAEEAFQFEHRDLHWGNVLIAPTDQKYATFVLRGRLYRAARCGVAATLIDYSLSRAARDGRALYNDLGDDDALFEAVGDYQFEVYRLMRDKLGNDWKNFEPYTNILWLHYTVDKMITALRYTRTNTKIHKHYIAKLKEIKNRVLDYGSATQFVLTDNEF